MNWLYILVVIGGIIYLIYQIFFNSGGKAKFKSDLPKTEQSSKKKVGIWICFSILLLISLALLIRAIILFL